MIQGNNALAVQQPYSLQAQTFNESLFERFIDFKTVYEVAY